MGYQIDTKGQANIVHGDYKLTFADVHFQDYTSFGEIKQDTLDAALDKFAKEQELENVFFSVKLSGTFRNIETRSAKATTPPYPSLLEVSKRQVEFFEEIEEGTILSYHAPQLYQGVTVAGFHSHFLSQDRHFGGHVLSAEIDQVSISLQIFEEFSVHLPANEEFYRKATLMGSKQLNQDIQSAE